MIREGKQVSIETGSEFWKFGLSKDENFGEEVLSITITKRELKETLKNTTTTRIVGIEEDEWMNYEKDFLFLSKPKDMVFTNSGSLILDEEYRHKLYVKGFW